MTGNPSRVDRRRHGRRIGVRAAYGESSTDDSHSTPLTPTRVSAAAEHVGALGRSPVRDAAHLARRRDTLAICLLRPFVVVVVVVVVVSYSFCCRYSNDFQIYLFKYYHV